MSDEQPLNHYQHSLEPNVKSQINRNILVLQAITCDVLRDLVPFVQFKKRENTHGGLLLLLKLQAFSLQLY